MSEVFPKKVEAITPALPDIKGIDALGKKLRPFLREAPSQRCYIPKVKQELWAKMECWQPSGSFKIRGAINNLMHLTSEEIARGVITASAGNHALSLATAAQHFNVPVKILMPKTVDKKRANDCAALGAEIVYTDTFLDLFPLLERLTKEEQKTCIHPFEGYHTTCATATIGLEIAAQMPPLDQLYVAIGGGGLISGVAYVMKTLQPQCEIIGVEPVGAATMTKSFIQQQICDLDEIDTIANSLSAPGSKIFSYSVCSHYVDRIILVDDQEILMAMRMLYENMAMAVEPAAATALAGIMTQTNQLNANNKIGFILCGSNMTFTELQQYIAMGLAG